MGGIYRDATFATCISDDDWLQREALENEIDSTNPESELNYHIEFVELLAAAATDNPQCQAMGRNVMPLKTVYDNLRKRDESARRDASPADLYASELSELSEAFGYKPEAFDGFRLLPFEQNKREIKRAYWHFFNVRLFHIHIR